MRYWYAKLAVAAAAIAAAVVGGGSLWGS